MMEQSRPEMQPRAVSRSHLGQSEGQSGAVLSLASDREGGENQCEWD